MRASEVKRASRAAFKVVSETGFPSLYNSVFKTAVSTYCYLHSCLRSWSYSRLHRYEICLHSLNSSVKYFCKGTRELDWWRNGKIENDLVPASHAISPCILCGNFSWCQLHQQLAEPVLLALQAGLHWSWVKKCCPPLWNLGHLIKREKTTDPEGWRHCQVSQSLWTQN